MKPKFKIWVVSDSHFSHFNIIKYCKRPFKSVEEMNEKMIKKWNNVVSKNDIVIDLGDAVFTKGKSQKIKDIFNRLNGRHILVRGNHSRKSYSFYLSFCVDFICERFSWYYNNKRILFIHSPHKVEYGDLKRHDYIIHGHRHDKGEHIYKKGNTIFIDVSVEKIGYTPKQLPEIINKAKNKYKR